MDVRNRNTLLSLFFASLAGCAPATQSPARFQHHFMSPPVAAQEQDAAGNSVSVSVIEPPIAIPINLFLASETPRLLAPSPRMPAKPTSTDLLVAQARDEFQNGRKAYSAGDKDGARVAFDRAIDLMWQASETSPDREEFQGRFETLVDTIHRLDLTGLDAGIVGEPGSEKPPLEDILELTFPVDPSLKNRVREEVRMSTSQLPLTVNDSVLGFLNYFSGRGHGTIVAGLRRAGKFRPMIQRILAEEGVPQELVHLAQAESGFLPRAVSRMRAVGMWQFVAYTGKQYGLNQGSAHDDRMDPEKATRAAARHLRDLYERYGDWYLAIAAYNCGAGNVDRAIQRTGHADFWILRERRTLPRETTNYVPIILAMTIMAKNPVDYNIDDVEPEAPLDYDTIDVTAPTHLGLIADLTETPVAELQDMNPSLLRTTAPAGFRLHVPKGAGQTLTARLQTVPAVHRASWRVHRLGASDSIETIAKRYGTGAAAVASANGLALGQLPNDREFLLVPRAYAEAGARAAANQRLASRLTAKAAKRRASPTRKASAGGKKSYAGASARASRVPVRKTSTKRQPVITASRARRG